MSLSRSEAARLNGSKSRGPRTPEGKQRSAMNALKHGCTADKVAVLQNELPEVFDRLFAAFVQKFQPQDDVESELVLQAACARWRLRRVWQLETSLFDLEMDTQREMIAKTFERCDEGIRQAIAFKSMADDSRSFDLVRRYEAQLTREYDRAIKALDRARAERTEQPSCGPGSVETGSEDSEVRNEPKPPVPLAGGDLQNEPEPAAALDESELRNEPKPPLIPLPPSEIEKRVAHLSPVDRVAAECVISQINQIITAYPGVNATSGPIDSAAHVGT